MHLLRNVKFPTSIMPEEIRSKSQYEATLIIVTSLKPGFQFGSLNSARR